MVSNGVMNQDASRPHPTRGRKFAHADADFFAASPDSYKCPCMRASSNPVTHLATTSSSNIATTRPENGIRFARTRSPPRGRRGSGRREHRGDQQVRVHRVAGGAAGRRHGAEHRGVVVHRRAHGDAERPRVGPHGVRLRHQRHAGAVLDGRLRRHAGVQQGRVRAHHAGRVLVSNPLVLLTRTGERGEGLGKKILT